jgi:phosphocarrier protein
MKTFTYVITDEIGIHARPAGILAKTAKAFASDITVTANGNSADATKLMSVMGLGIRKGTEITVNVTGSDEDKAAVELEKFFKANL